MKRHWNIISKNFLTQKKVVILSEKHVRTFDLYRSSQVFLLVAMLFIIIVILGVILLSAKLYDKVDSKSRKIYQMTQDQAFAKAEIAEMIESIDRMNLYFEKTNKGNVSNIIKHTKESEDAQDGAEDENSDEENTNDSDNSIDSDAEDVKKKDNKIGMKHRIDRQNSGKNLKHDASSKLQATHVESRVFSKEELGSMNVLEMTDILREKIQLWHAYAHRRYIYVRNMLSSLGFLGDCSSVSMFGRIINVTGDIVDSIKRVASFGQSSEKDLLAKVKSRLCNNDYAGLAKQVYSTNAIDKLVRDDAFIPSLIKLETIANNIPIGRPLHNLIRFGSKFGLRMHPVHHVRKMHAGVDLVGRYGSNIFSTASGRVVRAGWYNGYGWTVDVEHGYGFMTRYAHLSQVLVRLGQRVSAGQLVGKEGTSGTSTGPHLHFEVRINNTAVNPTRFVLLSR